MSELFALVLFGLSAVGVLGVVLVAVLCLLIALIAVRTIGVLVLCLVPVLALILVLLVFHCVNAPWFYLIAGTDCFPTARKVLPETGELFM